MSLGKELCSKSSIKNYSETAEKIWNSMKQPLLDFANETKEDGCTIVFLNIPDSDIQELKKIAEKEELVLYYWYPDSPGHPGVKNQDLGIISWNIDYFLQKYPFKVSTNILLVTLNKKDEIEIDFIFNSNANHPIYKKNY